jgi:hypothetical protein
LERGVKGGYRRAGKREEMGATRGSKVGRVVKDEGRKEVVGESTREEKENDMSGGRKVGGGDDGGGKINRGKKARVLGKRGLDKRLPYDGE